MNDITIFTYENTNIRTITTEDGELRFIPMQDAVN